MKNTSVILARIFSVLFLLVTILGSVSDLLPIGNALLKTNTILIVAHLILTFIFFFVAYLCINMSIQSLQMIGITYLLISGIGFMELNVQINGEWPHVIYLNLLSYFQFGLGITLCASGSILMKRQSKIAP